ncbi:hypothetical protein K1719_044795 [Acacia pycnantha]|nr:hypothetical protein K1719_044795 [Acacia pycnantha]
MSFAYWKNYYLKDLKVEPEHLSLRNFFAIMPSGGQISSWFDPNIEYYDEERDECEIEVDVPPNFRASKWSGIVVCLHIQGSDGAICWSSKAPEDEYNIWEERSRGIESLYGGDGLCVMVLEFNQKTCWQHLRGDNNSLHIQLSSHYNPRYWTFMGIWGYGWRVICKEDVENWCNPNHFNQFTQPQHGPPSEVKLPQRLLRKVIEVSVKPRWRRMSTSPPSSPSSAYSPSSPSSAYSPSSPSSAYSPSSEDEWTCNRLKESDNHE